MKSTSTITKLPDSKVELTVAVEAKDFMSLWGDALKKLQETVELDGFRKGNVPEAILIQKFGDMVVLEEMANKALSIAYIDAIKEHALIPVTDPTITITKIAKDNPFEAKIVVTVVPELTLPPYKKLSEEVIVTEAVTATDEEVLDVLRELHRGRKESGGHAHNHGDHTHDDHTHDHNSEHTHHHTHATPEEKDPVFDDAFAQSFGENFPTLDTLKAKIKDNLELEKKQKLREKNRGAILEKLIAETNVDIPPIMIEEETSRMLSQMKHDVTQFGGTWEEYLTHMKKTEDELKNSWKDNAKKRVLSQLILARIAEAEKLRASEEEIEVELVRLLAQVQDADEGRARDYLRQVLTNEKVLTFLEGK